jgi:hypothetical protein
MNILVKNINAISEFENLASSKSYFTKILSMAINSKGVNSSIYPFFWAFQQSEFLSLENIKFVGTKAWLDIDFLDHYSS